MLTVRPGADISRDSIVDYLESNNIQTRMLFAGNLVKHPCFDEMRQNKSGYRIINNLKNTDLIMSNTFWVGVYPGLEKTQIDYMIKKIRDYILDIK
jgi:CDP-6-deoxy-D-xylo-4-hexulose-3-dehydrase